jgi:outer membrane immunogenic protein
MGMVMKKFVLAAAAAYLGSASFAFAADMAVKAPAPVVAISTWTGFYGGLNGGWGWSNQNDWNTIGGEGSSFIGGGKLKGGLAGGQAGYNWQMNTLLVGVQIDGDWANIKGTAGNPLALNSGRCTFDGTPDQAASCTTKYKAMGNLTGRFGFLPLPNTLIYGKAGINWSSIDFRVSDVTATRNAGCGVIGTNNGSYNANNVSATGVTAGLGVEQRVWNKLTVFAEYDVIESGSGTWTNFNTGGTGNGGCTANFRSTTSLKPLSIVKFGINYLFN